VGVARGGWIPARLVADFFSIRFTVNIKVEGYEVIGEMNVEPIITQDVTINIKGKKVLVLDDIADTGASLKVVLESLKAKGVKVVKIATIFYKSSSIIKPDYYLEETDAWVIFAWEYFETISELSKLWKREGMNLSEVKEKFKAINIPPAIVESHFEHNRF